jgi:hypothetical protein
MEKDLVKFMNNVKIINKDLSLYEDDEKGIMFYLNTVNLLTRVDLLELDEVKYKIALFEKKIDKLDYIEEFIERPVPKNTITKKDEDKFTLINQKVKIKRVWNVSNTAGMFKSFTSKEEAIKFAKNINEEVANYLV